MFGLFETGFASFYWGNGVMLAVGATFLYLGIVKKMEPLLLVPTPLCDLLEHTTALDKLCHPHPLTKLPLFDQTHNKASLRSQPIRLVSEKANLQVLLL